MKKRGGDTKTRGRGGESSYPRVPASPRLHARAITLLTDFGTADYFVGAMKGVILSINPDAHLIDISHEIPPHDILSGAFTLAAASQNFPLGTIHAAVVDPGVGSKRRPLLVSGGGQFFVGPDNGLFSFILERERDARVFHVTNEDHFRRPVSATFHGRDVFAPVAAALSMGIAPEQLGVPVNDYVRLPEIRPKALGQGGLEASVIHIDRFGNCVTSLTRSDLTEEMIERGVALTINGRKVTAFQKFFAEGEAESDELFALWGSAGLLELAAFRASAAKILDARTGQVIKVTSDE